MANEAQKINPAELDKANISNEDLVALVESQGELIAEQAAKIAELETIAATLKEAAAAGKTRTAPTAPAGTFTVGKKEYRVTHGLQIRRDGALVKVSAEEILKDKELREQLVRSNSNAVQPV